MEHIITVPLFNEIINFAFKNNILLKTGIFNDANALQMHSIKIMNEFYDHTNNKYTININSLKHEILALNLFDTNTVNDFCDNISSVYTSNEQYLLDKINSHIKFKEYSNQISNLIETFREYRNNPSEINQNKIDISVFKLSNYVKEKNEISTTDELNFIDIDDDYYEYNKEEFKKIKSTFDIINQNYNGYSVSTLNFIIAETGVGKTMALCLEAIEMYKNGHNVILVSIEMSLEEVNDRILKMLYNLDNNTILKFKNDLSFRLNVKNDFRYKNKNVGKLKIINGEMNETTFTDISNKISKFEKKDNIIYECVLIDYLQILSTDKKNTEGLHSVGDDIATAASTYAKNTNKLVLSVAQVTGQIKDDNFLHTMSKSSEYARKAALVVGLRKEIMSNNRNLYYLNIQKVRNGSMLSPKVCTVFELSSTLNIAQQKIVTKE